MRRGIITYMKIFLIIKDYIQFFAQKRNYGEMFTQIVT